MSTALTYYFNTASSTTLASTADVLTQALNSGVAVSKNTLIGLSTGFGEAWSKGNASTWAGGGSLPSTPTGNGWIDDSTVLEGQSLYGNWAPTIRLTTSIGSIVADSYLRYWKYNAGTYTLLQTFVDNGAGSGRTINTTGVTINFTAANPGLLSFVTGDKLYISLDVNIRSNSTTSSSANLKVTTCSTATGGVVSAQLATPGIFVLASETITETATDATLETVSLVEAFSQAVPETATGTETVTLLETFAASITETGTGSETITLLETFTASISEVATGSEVITSNGVMPLTVVESATGSEVIAAIAVKLNTITETASGTELVTLLETFSQTVIETATGSEAITLINLFSQSVSETATGSEVVSANGLMSLTVVETATDPSFELVVLAEVEGPIGETLEYDTFKRTSVSNGWGTSTDGNAWYNRQGASTSLSTDGNHAYIASSSGVRTYLSLGTTIYNDQDNWIRITYGTNNDTVGVAGRLSGDASINGVNGYRYSVPGNGGASTNGVLYKVVNGVETLLATGSAITVGTANKYVFRIVISGQTTPRIQAKFWINGHFEPSAWDVDYTDTDPVNIINTGAPGITGIASTATAIKYDTFNSDAPGGAIAEQNVQEVATGSEVVSLLETFAASITETPSGTEIITLLEAFSQPIVEVATGSELVSFSEVLLLTVLEFASGTEAVIAGEIDLGIVVEVATGTETVSLFNPYTFAVTEFPSGTETIVLLEAFSQTVLEVATETETITLVEHFIQAVTETGTGSETVTMLETFAPLIVESATGSEIITVLNKYSMVVVETATGTSIAEIVIADDVIGFTIVESATGSELVTVTLIVLSVATAQMQASDLGYEYERILNNITGSQLKILATTYYGNSTNNQVVYGELDALMNYENINQLHSMRTINDVTNFLQSYEYASNVLNDNPIVYYRLGEIAGSTSAYDISGRNMTASINGGVTLAQPGALAVSTDTAMLFNGTTGYLQLPQGVNTANWNNCSIEGWINFSNVSFGNTVAIVANDTPASSHVGVKLAATKSSLLFTAGFGSTSTTVSKATYAFAASTWYHIVAVYAYANFYLYINGSQVATASGPSSPIAQTTGTMYIAKNPPDVTNGFPGLLDEIAIYNTALSASRVNAHYLAGTTP